MLTQPNFHCIRYTAASALIFLDFFKVIAILVPQELSYFFDHHSEILHSNSIAFKTKPLKLTNSIELVVTIDK